ncbi:hypothetical protein [Halarcobacter anaerophilus]|jgi:hypothetical protein|uniref:Uncharacterized protein n=1 Tax=Halarcobacter anaerophilus TaxID=877500 RepID=A0A4Q0XY32_9BACT|nr:hypothetical protein [Halarcobacter anaerophilus]QDF28443.1 hypothetical protein AANAER_0952 [Halarcobacter anaerophilus]RXJ61644.1 hypothetical protein CRV06_12610 [Halarcobacter anaerophilus]
MKKLILFLLFTLYSFAVTPYSLENLKEVNLKVLNKKNEISEKLEKRLNEDIKVKLEKAGIKTKTEKYSNFLVKIKINKIKDINFVRTSIMISEDVIPLRDKDVEALAITYKKDDSFEAENLEKDIYESIVDYLLEDFLEQYKDEN